MDAVLTAGVPHVLRRVIGRRVVYGQDDCALWCADIVRAATGFDPAADLRGTYSDFAQCRSLIMMAGGLHALVAKRMNHPALRSCGADASEAVAVLHVEGVTLCAYLRDGRATLRVNSGLRLVDCFRIVEAWTWSRL